MPSGPYHTRLKAPAHIRTITIQAAEQAACKGVKKYF